MHPVVQPNDVLKFWFDDDGARFRRAWFERNDMFDADCRARFAETLGAACRGELDHWQGTADGTLALVIVLDQLSRNLHRDSPEAFAADAKARNVARAALASGIDRQLGPVQRIFLYLPFEHSEDRADQDLSVWLAETLRGTFPEADGSLDYARRHREVIDRFGRFPHRNRTLGRISSAEEIAWLAAHPSGF
ncbi:MAG TPA: DUF924 family protein [Acetobacteraceae bacterium]|nr:DUF924 family protein [Acetobacteraceae bacterium]